MAKRKHINKNISGPTTEPWGTPRGIVRDGARFGFVNARDMKLYTVLNGKRCQMLNSDPGEPRGWWPVSEARRRSFTSRKTDWNHSCRLCLSNWDNHLLSYLATKGRFDIGLKQWFSNLSWRTTNRHISFVSLIKHEPMSWIRCVW